MATRAIMVCALFFWLADAGCSASAIKDRRPQGAGESRPDAGKSADAAPPPDGAVASTGGQAPVAGELRDAGDEPDAGDALTARVRAGGVEVRGPLSEEAIRRIVQRHINEVQFCYAQELSAHPELAGRVVVQFLIGDTGSVHTASVTESSLGNARVEQCIAKAVRRWTFPTPEAGATVTVTIAFVLQSTS